MIKILNLEYKTKGKSEQLNANTRYMEDLIYACVTLESIRKEGIPHEVEKDLGIHEMDDWLEYLLKTISSYYNVSKKDLHDNWLVKYGNNIAFEEKKKQKKKEKKKKEVENNKDKLKK